MLLLRPPFSLELTALDDAAMNSPHFMANFTTTPKHSYDSREKWRRAGIRDFFNEEHSGLIGIKLTRQHSQKKEMLETTEMMNGFYPLCVSGFLKCFMRQEFSLC